MRDLEVNDEVYNVLRRRSGRAMGAVLGCVDEIGDDELRHHVRKTVLDEFNELTNLACELIRSVDSEATVVNTYFLEMLERLDQKISHG